MLQTYGKGRTKATDAERDEGPGLLFNEQLNVTDEDDAKKSDESDRSPKGRVVVVVFESAV